MSCLYIWEIHPLSVVLFANIFSHSVVYLFILLMVSSAVQKLISLIRSHLFIFAFISIALEDCYVIIFKMLVKIHRFKNRKTTLTVQVQSFKE